MADHSELVAAVRASAQRLGVNPSDLLTAMSYETGGRLDPNLWGGKNNNHLGLIQFGGPERAKYGVKPGMAVTDQVMAAENFLRDRGLKPGMGLLDLYSTINAGRPGLYNRSDANNGGAPGTVADKVATQMVGHRARANALLGEMQNSAAPAAMAVAPGRPGGGPAAVAAPASAAPAVAAAPAAVPFSLAPGGAAAAPVDAGMASALAALAAIPAAAQDEGIKAVPLPEIQYFKPNARRIAAAIARNPLG